MMAGYITVTVVPDTKIIAQGIKNLDRRLYHMADFWKTVLTDIVIPSIERNFRSEHSPDGSQWAPLAQRTLADRARLGFSGPMGIRTGQMLSYITAQRRWKIRSTGLEGSIDTNPTGQTHKAMLFELGSAGRHIQPARHYWDTSLDIGSKIDAAAELWTDQQVNTILLGFRSSVPV